MANDTTQKQTYRVTTVTRRGKPGPSETTMDVVAISPQKAVEDWAAELREERAYLGLTCVVELPGGYKFTCKV
jgi:hypothetical protein